MRTLAALSAAAALFIGPAAQAQLTDTSDPLAFEFAPTAQSVSMPSAILGETRRLDVWTPDSYRTSTHGYGVVLVLDGGYLFEHAQVAAHYLAAAALAPDLIVVGLRTDDRVADYTPAAMPIPAPDARGETYARHVVEEVLPALRRRYRVDGPVVLVGHSQSAIQAVYAAAQFPNAIDAVLALDAPMNVGENWLVNTINRRPAARGFRLHSVEVTFGWSDADWQGFSARAGADWRLARTKLTRESHQNLLMLGCYLGLRDLFPEFGFNLRNAIAALEHYQALPDFYGENPAPPEEVLRWATEDYWIADDEPHARAALAQWRRDYGADPEMARLQTQIDLMRSRPLPRRLPEYLSQRPPSATEIAPFVGEWRGVETIAPGVEQTMTVRISVANGVGVGELTIGQAPAQTLDYLAVADGGLQFGVMNGMRPRGLLLYASRLDANGVLRGAMNFAGIRFDHAPGGGEPPPFYLARQ